MDFFSFSFVSYFCSSTDHPLWCLLTLDEMLEFKFAGSFTVSVFEIPKRNNSTQRTTRQSSGATWKSPHTFISIYRSLSIVCTTVCSNGYYYNEVHCRFVFSNSAKDISMVISFWNEWFLRQRPVQLPFCMCLFISTFLSMILCLWTGLPSLGTL